MLPSFLNHTLFAPAATLDSLTTSSDRCSRSDCRCMFLVRVSSSMFCSRCISLRVSWSGCISRLTIFFILSCTGTEEEEGKADELFGATVTLKTL